MLPPELDIDAAGLNRIERIARADRDLATARLMAAEYAHDPSRGFEAFGDPYCEFCPSQKACGLRKYRELIRDAAEGYAAAGLWLLFTRVDPLWTKPPSTAWREFDRLNQAEEL